MRTLYFCPVISIFLPSLFFYLCFPRLISAVGDCTSTILPHSANLECMSEMCCTWLAGNTGCKKLPSRHHRKRTSLSGHIFATKECIDNGKKLVKHWYLLTCPQNMVNFGPITAENCWRVWGTPANFNGFRILAALLHSTPAVGVSQTLRRWTESATYIRQGGHHVGQWPTFQVMLYFYVNICIQYRQHYWGNSSICLLIWMCYLPSATACKQ